MRFVHPPQPRPSALAQTQHTDEPYSVPIYSLARSLARLARPLVRLLVLAALPVCLLLEDHLTLVNAGDEEVVSQEEGEGGGRRRGRRRKVLLRERYRYRTHAGTQGARGGEQR